MLRFLPAFANNHVMCPVPFHQPAKAAAIAHFHFHPHTLLSVLPRLLPVSTLLATNLFQPLLSNSFRNLHRLILRAHLLDTFFKASDKV